MCFLCVTIHNSSLVCMVGITYVYCDTIFAFYGCIFLYPSLLLSWMSEHGCSDTCCFRCLICMSFVFLYLKGALVIRSSSSSSSSSSSPSSSSSSLLSFLLLLFIIIIIILSSSSSSSSSSSLLLLLLSLLLWQLFCPLAY